MLLEHFASIVLKQETHNISPLHIPAFHKSDSSAESGSGGGSGSGRGRGGAKSEEEKESLKRLVGFMSRHYQQIFKVQLCSWLLIKFDFSSFSCADPRQPQKGGTEEAGFNELWKGE